MAIGYKNGQQVDTDWLFNAVAGIGKINGRQIASGGDPHFASVSLLLHCDGSDASTSFPDSSPIGHTVSAAGNAQVDTADQRFGTGSLLLDGATDRLEISDHASLQPGSGNFTIECWIKPVESKIQGIFAKRSSTLGATAWDLYLGNNNEISWRGEATSANGAVTQNTWQHVALTRNGTALNIWVNGSSVATNPSDTRDYSATNTLLIGRRNAAANNDFNGWIDEIRITKGVARYTAPFTPTGPFPNS